MITRTTGHTVEEFDDMVMQPENADKRLEYIEGEVVEVVSNNYSSETAATLLAEIKMFIKGKNLGRVTGADGGYRVGDERYIPDVAFISRTKQPEPSYDAYNPNAPDLAVEVLSPTDDPADVRIKIFNYLRAGVVVWLVDPEKKQVEVYMPGVSPRKLGLDDTLDGGAVLPDFRLPVKDIFPQ